MEEDEDRLEGRRGRGGLGRFGRAGRSEVGAGGDVPRVPLEGAGGGTWGRLGGGGLEENEL